MLIFSSISIGAIQVITNHAGYATGMSYIISHYFKKLFNNYFFKIEFIVNFL